MPDIHDEPADNFGFSESTDAFMDPSILEIANDAERQVRLLAWLHTHFLWMAEVRGWDTAPLEFARQYCLDEGLPVYFESDPMSSLNPTPAQLAAAWERCFGDGLPEVTHWVHPRAEEIGRAQWLDVRFGRGWGDAAPDAYDREIRRLEQLLAFDPLWQEWWSGAEQQALKIDIAVPEMVWPHFDERKDSIRRRAGSVDCYFNWPSRFGIDETQFRQVAYDDVLAWLERVSQKLDLGPLPPIPAREPYQPW